MCSVGRVNVFIFGGDVFSFGGDVFSFQPNVFTLAGPVFSDEGERAEGRAVRRTWRKSRSPIRQAQGKLFGRLRAGSPGTPGCGSTRPSEDCGPAHHERWGTGHGGRGAGVGRGLGCVQSVGPMCPVFGRMCSVSRGMCPLWRPMCPVFGGAPGLGLGLRWEGVLLQGGMEGGGGSCRIRGMGGADGGEVAVAGVDPGVWELAVSRAAGGSADLGTADGRGQSGDQGAGLLFVGPVWGGVGRGGRGGRFRFGLRGNGGLPGEDGIRRLGVVGCSRCVGARGGAGTGRPLTDFGRRRPTPGSSPGQVLPLPLERVKSRAATEERGHRQSIE